MKDLLKFFKALLIISQGILFCSAAPSLTSVTTNAEDSISPSAMAAATARELYNAGTKKLFAGKLDEAEAFLESSLARQDERVQAPGLYNLGHVRFAQGMEELKKSPDAATTTRHSLDAAADGVGAIQKVTDALENDEVSSIVEAYIAGRGVRKEMRDALKVVRRALELHGRTLSKWRRSLNDFQSAAELNPTDVNAARNAEIVEQAIARLVDSMQEMQQAAENLGDKQSRLNMLLKQLKGKIPSPNMPPGASGGDEEEDGDDGQKPSPESLSGLEEANKGAGGQEMGLKISAEQAGQLMNGIRPDGKSLPMGQGETGAPKNHSGRIW